MERKRKLQQEGAKLSRILNTSESRADSDFITFRGVRLVSEVLPQLRGELESGIGGHLLDPAPAMFGAQRLIERRIDLDRIEEFGQIGRLSETLVACARDRRSRPNRHKTTLRAQCGPRPESSSDVSLPRSFQSLSINPPTECHKRKGFPQLAMPHNPNSRLKHSLPLCFRCPLC